MGDDHHSFDGEVCHVRSKSKTAKHHTTGKGFLKAGAVHSDLTYNERGTT